MVLQSSVRAGTRGIEGRRGPRAMGAGPAQEIPGPTERGRGGAQCGTIYADRRPESAGPGGLRPHHREARQGGLDGDRVGISEPRVEPA